MDYVNAFNNNVDFLNNILNDIQLNNENINSIVTNLAKFMKEHAFTVFGKTKRLTLNANHPGLTQNTKRHYDNSKSQGIFSLEIKQF